VVFYGSFNAEETAWVSRLKKTNTRSLLWLVAFGLVGLSATWSFGQAVKLDFEAIKPVLSEYCFGCHADGATKGNMSFDSLLSDSDTEHRNLNWDRVLKQLQAGLMPPVDEPQPTADQVSEITNWIKFVAFGLDARSPDPGRVTIRRLNQVEYRNTIRDLLGVDYDTSTNFPADDTGHGFDNIGDVLSMSPLLLEKYVNAAKDIVSSVVPTVSGIVRERRLYGDSFKPDSANGERTFEAGSATPDRDNKRQLTMSYYESLSASSQLVIEQAGDYVLRLNISANETYVDNQFDDNSCEFTFSLDGIELFHERFVRQGAKEYTFDVKRPFQPGTYNLVASVKPTSNSPKIRRLRLELKSVDLIGPHDEKFFVRPKGYEKFFPRDVPHDTAGRKAYARELLGSFARRAFRRPVDDDNLGRLVGLAESVYRSGEDTFESGIAKSMTAILASPRFLFREESLSVEANEDFPLIDEYSLASRLSYFLWSTMPDDELVKMAETGKLRENLDAQIDRMLHHDKSAALSENFVGQWLRARALGTIQINTGAVLGREPVGIDPEADIRRQRFFALFRKGRARTEQENAEFEQEKKSFLRSFGGGSRAELTDDVRTAMRRETEMVFQYIVSENRSLLELVDSDYTFLNETLWAHYQISGIEPVEGGTMRLVRLPAGSQRGGILTQGTTLVVTSNPDRTSPVKRGLFLLENLLGVPPAAPPPNIPALEDVKAEANKKISLRETLAIHRKDALCSSCHNQMDPLGLALENFNALGLYRTIELGQPIEAGGELLTGEKFTTVSELKKILVAKKSSPIYRCIAEKMMTYALGRSVEYTDAVTIDSLVDELEAQNGRAQSLVRGIIRSNAFQRTRKPDSQVVSN
jgi:Protein of unknown function (DUF1592)/Protein of unknown function (DUF1588)/Protein of unknown function (DUF1587)/Protein of unknown function (DUF1585)/Protein of unknown function (DUF1595)